MLASWPVLLMHDLVGIGLLFLMLEIWQQWKAVWSFEPRWSRELARQRRREALAESRALPGLARRPVCAECRAVPEKKEVPPSPPPRLEAWPAAGRQAHLAIMRLSGLPVLWLARLRQSES